MDLFHIIQKKSFQTNCFLPLFIVLVLQSTVFYLLSLQDFKKATMSGDIAMKTLMEQMTAEISQVLGVNDPTLSKFIVSLYEESKNNEDFNNKLKEMGGEFPETFIKKCRALIEAHHPKYRIQQENTKVKKEEISLPGLSIPNISWEELKKQDPDEYTSEEELKYSHKIKSEISSQKHQRRDASPDTKNYDHYSRKRNRQNDRTTKFSNYDEVPIPGKVYAGRIVNLTAFGAFVHIYELKHPIDGLCHISAISSSRINHPSDVLKFDQECFVKVLKVDGKRVSLSMKNIDQATGEETKPDRARPKIANYNTSAKKRLTSPERWEIRQLIASGVISANEYKDLEEDANDAFKVENAMKPEEDIDIEIISEEPPFLKGLSKEALQLAPIKVVKAPEGSLHRAAMSGSQLVRERKEQKLQEAKEASQSMKEVKDNSEEHANKGKPSGNESYASEWRKLQMSKNLSYGKRSNMSIKDQRSSLPVYKMRSSLIQSIRENQFVVIVGETGSGKTTQITQYLAEEGFNEHGMIGCTQPRRVAAVSVAKRVAEEVGCKVGQKVGYTIRFEDRTSPETVIKYMTDGMLQREALNDPKMKKYSVIMLDEAHERTISTDILFALLKKAAEERPELKIIVTSATLDAEKFSKYFCDCPIMKIPGRTFPVEILYTKEPEMDYLASALDTVIQVHISEPAGDILVFLTGQEEIDTSCEALFERMKALGNAVPDLIILPVYSSLPSEMQSRIFEPTPDGSRKVILATNIAETSITIDGVYYVIDPGFVKINAYDPKLGMDSLTPAPISKAQASQRAGRAGRTGPGKCYRLYTESAFKNEMLENTVPEIQRQNLSHTILMLKAMGINDLQNFEFMDPPSSTSMAVALDELYKLSALDESGYLTTLGRKMADFPMGPALAKTLITSVDFQCSEEILTIVAMLSVPTIFYRPKDKQEQADKQKAKFHHPYGDHLTFLNVYNAWILSDCSKSWCSEHYIQDRSMRKAEEVRKQLWQIMRKHKYPIISCGMNVDKVRRTLCSGFFQNSAKRDPQEGFKTILEKTTVYLHPSSALFGKSSEYVIYHTLLLTTKEYMHCTTSVDPKWLIESAPTLFQAADPKRLSDSKKNIKIVPLFDKFNRNQDAWRISSFREAKSKALTGGQKF